MSRALAIIGTVAAVFGAGWAVFVYLSPPASGPPTTNVEAIQGVGAGGNVENNQITIDAASDGDGEER